MSPSFERASMDRVRPGFRRARFLCANALVLLSVGLSAATGTARPAQADDTQKKVLHVDSYHEGNEWNDRIVAALRETLAAKGVGLRVVHLDAKRHPAEAD